VCLSQRPRFRTNVWQLGKLNIWPLNNVKHNRDSNAEIQIENAIHHMRTIYDGENLTLELNGSMDIIDTDLSAGDVGLYAAVD
jgi:hypothetical protein